MSWTSIENALVAGVKAASGFASGAVLWTGQPVGQRAGSFITMQFGELVAEDPLTPQDTTAVDLTAVGAEITHSYRTVKEFTLSVAVYTAAVTGDSSALAVAAKTQNALILPTVRRALGAAGLGLLSVGAVRYMPAIKGTDFEARAFFECRFQVFETSSETTTYIERVWVGDTGLLVFPGVL